MRIPHRLPVAIPLLALLMSLTTSAAGADVSRFVDQKTFLAAEADLTKVDAAALDAFLLRMAEAMGVAGEQPFQTPRAEVQPSLAVVSKWINDMKQAGVSELYAVADFARIEHPPTIIIPVPDDKAAAVSALVPRPRADVGPRDSRMPAVETVPGVGVVFAAPAAIADLKALKPAPRPDLAAALKAAGAAPIRLAVSFDAGIRQELSRKMPPQLMGKPSTLITNDFQWLSISATLPPTPNVKALVQTTDADTAKQTAELIATSLKEARRQPQMPPEFEQILAPTVAGSQVVVSLDDKQMTALATAISTPLMRARAVARRVQSASNIRQMLMACMMFKNDNKNAWPADRQAFEQAVAKYARRGRGGRDVLVNPQHPDVRPAYVYIKPSRPDPDPQSVVIYESHKEFGEGINVGFADGHVEWVAQKKAFDEMLARTAQDAAPQ